MAHRGSSLLLIVLFTFILGNLFIINLKLFYPEHFLFLSQTDTALSPSPALQKGSIPDDLSCPTSCVALINQVSSPSAIGSLEIPLTPVVIQQGSTTREVYIPLGNGTTQKSDWDNLTATETIINPTSFGTFKEAYLTYSLRNPTQNGQTEARLYNVTDNYAIYGSHVIMNGPSSQTINTLRFSLPIGNKLYRVQLRSSLSYPAYLDNAKMRIVTE